MKNAHETLTRAEVFNVASTLTFKNFAGQKNIFLGDNSEFIMILNLTDENIKYTSRNGHVYGQVKFAPDALKNILHRE